MLRIPILTAIDGTVIRVLTKPIEFLERKLLRPIDIRAGFNRKLGRLTALTWLPEMYTSFKMSAEDSDCR